MALTQTQVSQLYVSIFGRASEGEGNKYWATNGKDMASTANTMLATDAAKAYFGDSLKSNDAFIKHIYKNTLGKEPTDDAAGIKFWVDMLASGKSRGEVVATMIWSAQQESNKGVAQDMFNNKVKVSNYVAENIEKAGDNLDLFKGFIEKVTSTEASLKEAKAGVDAIKGNAALPAALKALADAKAAKANYLKTLPELDTDFSGTIDVKAGKATASDVSTMLTNVTNSIKAAGKVNDANFATRSAETQDMLIKEALNKLQKAQDDAAKDAKVSVALFEAANTKSSAVQKAVAVEEKVAESFKVETAKFEAYTANAALKGKADFEAAVDNDKYGVENNQLISKNGAGIATVLAKKVDGVWTIQEAGKSLEGVLEFLKFYDEKKAAEDNTKAAKVALAKAVEAIIVAETGAYKVQSLGDIYNVEAGNHTFNLSGSNAKIFKTKEVAEAAGVVEVYELDLTDVKTGADNDTVTIAITDGSGGNSANITGATGLAHSQQGAVLAGKLNGATVTFKGLEYKIAQVGTTAKITLTAKEAKASNGSIKLTVTNNGSTDDEVGISTEQAPKKAGTAVDFGAETPALTKAIALETAIKSLNALKTDKENFETARTYNDRVEELTKAITKAEKAISNKVDDKEAPGLGLNLLDYKTETDATTGNDVLLFENSVANKVFNQFGDAGLDRLYFGEKYKFVQVKSDADVVGKATGDVSTLEIFYKEEGSTVKFYVEKNAFSGQANGAEEYAIVTLTGIAAKELTIADGFVSAGTLA